MEMSVARLFRDFEAEVSRSRDSVSDALTFIISDIVTFS